MSKPSDDTAEHLPRPIAQALERQNRRLERIETKIDRILDLVQKIDTRMEDDIDEFVEFDEFDDEDEAPPNEEIIKQLEKLPPEEFKQRFVQLLASMEAAAKEAREEEEDEDEDEEP